MENQIFYKSGYKYQLHKTYVHQLRFRPPIEETVETDYIILTPDGVLTIKKGYAWDGASGPTYDSKNSMRGSLVHDVIYQLIRMQELPEGYRDEADEELFLIVLEDGMSKFRANIWLFGVENFAGFAADPDNLKPIECAP